ncbi:MAG: 50S ribosomal protein L9 [Isosphaeraceae bacterium]|jgi:large subunit ribosomal protein L9|nr:MAG: 50S ribosomal protein L9 [Isosphaeraceae bacterium]
MAKSPAKPTAAKSKPKAKTGPKPAPVIPRQPGVERRKNHPLRAQNGYMRVILTHKVDKLGGPGDLVKVRPGYARNYLIPQGLATFATPHNVRMVEKHRERLRQLEEAKRADLQNLAAQIAQRSISIEANANAEGHLYGSVTAAMIATALRAENLPVEEENVRMEAPIRELGLYTIPLSLGLEVTTEIKLWVVPTHTDEVPAS